jgi:hypothetical protein
MGGRQLGEPLSRLPSLSKAGQLERWLASLELLSRFPSWVEFVEETIQWLWGMRNIDGWWDLGSRSVTSVMLPLSDHWRRKKFRQIDWTTRILLLMSAYYSKI